MNKSTIYLDMENDITAIIDKVKSAEETIVAVVPPKRMPALQSAVNLKLLKKAAADAKKRMVIITSDAALLPLAGSVGLYVAENLKSRPYLPDGPDTTSDKPLVINEDSADEVPHAPVSAAETEAKKDEADDKDGKPTTKVAGKVAALGSLPKIKGKLPNFSRFRLRLIFGGVGLVLLIVLWFVAYKVLPKADVVVNAQTSKIDLDFGFTLDSKLEADDIAERKLVPITETLKQEFTSTVETSGEKNVGKKSSGTLTIYNCYSSQELPIAAGTELTSTNNSRRYITNEAVDIPAGTFAGGCTEPGSTQVSVTARSAGTSSNQSSSSTTYSVKGEAESVYAKGSIGGGTDEVVQVVAQKDLDDAAEALEVDNHDEYESELLAQFDTSVIALPTTFRAKQGKPSGQPAVGEEAEEVVVKLIYTYTMKGVSGDSLGEILDAVMVEEVGTNDLRTYDNGLSGATFEVDGNDVAVSANGFVGPEIDEQLLAEEIAGLRFSAAKDLIEARPGVLSVDITLSPFWVFSLPKADKITITVDISEHALQ